MYSGAGVDNHGVAYLQQQEKCSAQHKHMGDLIAAAEHGYKVGTVASETRCRKERMLLLGDANFQSFVLFLPCFALFQRLV